MIYLDYNATTPVYPEVVEAMLPHFSSEFGNASSAHRLGSRARCAVEDARERVAALIGAPARDVVFTSGGTESNNLALQGSARASAAPAHIVTTAIEHASVLSCLRELERCGWAITVLPVDSEGRVSPSAVEGALRPETKLVTIAWANNEIGTIQPIEAIGRLCRERSVRLHVDAAQAVGKLRVSCENVDMLSLSAHKLGGPKGVGALYVRAGTPLRPLSFGGSQERDLRAGTENVAGIVGLGAACALVPARLEHSARLEDRRERLWHSLRGLGARRHSPVRGCLANTLNVSFGLDADAVVAGLDLRGVAVSSGSACAAGASAPSHVLVALGCSETEARSAVRFSLGFETSAADVDRAGVAVADLLATAKRSAAGGTHG